MYDSNYQFPGQQGLLAQPVSVENTDGNIEIVRPFSGRSLSVGLFDFDGTLSDERVGWPNLIVANNVAYLIAFTSPHLEHRQAEELVLADIEATIGIPTYLQMKRLRTIIEKHGYQGPELDLRMFKDSYNDALVGMVSSRRAQLATGEMTMDDLRIDGAMELLQGVSARLSKGIYLASGSDLDAVTESVEHLGYSEFFPKERIAAAGSLGPEDDAKEAVIQGLLSNSGNQGDSGIRGEELVTFGDGFPEMLYTHRAGGVCVGIVSRDESHYEHLGHFTEEQKKQRLLNAGAHLIVHKPYQNVPELLDAIFKGYEE
jgi:beta-phosphoglucomutase-like phosphatase (HAD superfamily)